MGRGQKRRELYWDERREAEAGRPQQSKWNKDYIGLRDVIEMLKKVKVKAKADEGKQRHTYTNTYTRRARERERERD